jgi:hypothetical protein
VKTLISNYTFNPTTKAIALLDYTTIDLAGLLLITNVRTNQIIYNFADPAFGGTTSGNTLILTTATTGMSAADKLQIFYDNGEVPASEETLQSLNDIISYLKLVVQNTKVLNTQDTSQRQRVAVEAMPTTTVSGSVTVGGTVAVSSLAGTVNANTAATYGEITNRQEMSRLEFAQGIRNNLVF